jgi:hypothetical protein
LLKFAPDAKLLEKDFWYPQAKSIIELALKAIKSKKLVNAFNLEPIYLYPKECQIRPVNDRRINTKLHGKSRLQIIPINTKIRI